MKLILIASLAISGLWGSTILTVRGLSGAVATDQYVALGSAECHVFDALPPTGGGACEAQSFVNQSGMEIPDWLSFNGWHLGAALSPASAGERIGDVISLTPTGVGLITFSLSGRHDDGRRASGIGVVTVHYPELSAQGGPWAAALFFSELPSQLGEALRSQTTATPEPASFALAGVGLMALAVVRRRGR